MEDNLDMSMFGENDDFEINYDFDPAELENEDDDSQDDDSQIKKRDIDRGTDDDDDDEYNEDYQILRANASSFVLNNLGYVACGDNSTSVWQYNPVTDLWTEKTPLEASGRIDAIAFAVNNRGFVMLGRSGTSYFDNLMEFKPNDEQVDND